MISHAQSGLRVIGQNVKRYQGEGVPKEKDLDQLNAAGKKNGLAIEQTNQFHVNAAWLSVQNGRQENGVRSVKSEQLFNVK